MAPHSKKILECDYHNILNLVNRCNIALDEGSVDSFVDCFCEQGVYRVTAPNAKKQWSGRSELIEASIESALSNSKRRPTRTWMNSNTINSNGDDVDHKAFFLVLTTGANPDTIAFGRIEDKLAFTSGHWKLMQRHMILDYSSTNQ